MAPVKQPPGTAGIGPQAPVAQVHRIVIELQAGQLRVSHTEDVIQTLGMLSLADAEIKAKLKGHEKEEKKTLVLSAKRANIPYPPPPDGK